MTNMFKRKGLPWEYSVVVSSVPKDWCEDEQVAYFFSQLHRGTKS